MNFPALSGIQAIQQGQAPQLGGLRNLVGPSPQDIQGFNTQQIELLRGIGQAQGLKIEEDAPFESLFQAYLGLVNSAGNLENQAQTLQVEYALGQHDDMLAVILAQEMAYTAMYFTVQVTNRVIEAYREIMRMQI